MLNYLIIIFISKAILNAPRCRLYRQLSILALRRLGPRNKPKGILVAKVEEFYNKRVADGATPLTFFSWRERRSLGGKLGILVPPDDEEEPEEEKEARFLMRRDIVVYQCDILLCCRQKLRK